jgi:prevent-host-death family protein
MLAEWLPNSYFLRVGRHTLVEAKNRLSNLIDRALKGEGVVITRHGRPVVELKPVAPAAAPITQDAIDWLVQRRVGRRMPREGATKLVRRMRDEWDR